MKIRKIAPLVLLLVMARPAFSEEGASPLDQGLYVAPMLSYEFPDNSRVLDDGPGAVLSLGYRLSQAWAVEVAAEYADLDRDVPSGGSSKVTGGTLNLMGFPSTRVRGLFLGLGAGYLQSDEQGLSGNSQSDPIIEGGIGYLIPLSFGLYDFALRAEARTRFQRREDGSNDDDSDPRGLNDAQLRLGLQLPFGKRQPPPPPEPVQVVAPVAICADGQDNDSDGQTDFPNDPGCTAADDNDETDPPVCADGKDNDGDGLIDFPSDKGCTAADDQDEVDPCKTPAPGERISLKGCGTGDIIVLRGVNFEFDKARLTANAKTILDNVSEELTAYPEIKVELSGHTDAKGSDEYNQTLSEKRAASVLAYLKRKGIAADRMTSVGYGENKPVADNETDEGRELNRRVELKVTEGVAAVALIAPELAPAADAPAPVDPAATDGAVPEAAATDGAVVP